MSEGFEHLKQDLIALEAMAAEMEDYLKSEVLFWPLQHGGLPRLTLGGYLMRQHRLLALRNSLNMDEQSRLYAAINTFNQSIKEKVVRLEQRAHQELHARLRQWLEYFKDLQQSKGASAYFASSVEIRAIIEAIIHQLQIAPYQIDPQICQELAQLDAQLANQWQPDKFVWSVEWEEAYPKGAYWWLYGHPQAK